FSKTKETVRRIVDDTPFTELEAYYRLFELIPPDTTLYMGNSLPVRYLNLLAFKPLRAFSNRGVSGIDGALSSAMGFASVSDSPVTAVIGDLGFLYELSAAFLSASFKKLKTVIFNNRGGGIFSFIEKTDKEKIFSTYFELSHNLTFERIAEQNRTPYISAANREEFLEGLERFSHSSPPLIFEVVTETDLNKRAYDTLFSALTAL
ncbi:MAG: hypothetical protein D6808_03830, partial [Candidatus Dadabacteria bacterium]